MRLNNKPALNKIRPTTFYSISLFFSGSFVSMYDEPRRRAAVANRQERKKQISKQKKVASQAAIKQKTKRPVQQISESSDTESASEKELTDHVLIEENNVTIDETKKTLTTEKEDEISDLEMLCNLIRLEHNYSSPSRPQKTKTKAKTKEKRRILREKHINKQRELSDDEDNLETIKPEPLLKFSLRTNEQENSILMDLFNYGIDAEDLEHFKTAFDHLKESDTDSSITKGLTWGDHPCIFFKFIAKFFCIFSLIIHYLKVKFKCHLV